VPPEQYKCCYVTRRRNIILGGRRQGGKGKKNAFFSIGTPEYLDAEMAEPQAHSSQ
jgi:hypothetical protein